MSKSAIYLVNNSLAEVLEGGVIPLGSIIRRYGQNVRQDGNAVTVCDDARISKCSPGYYKVDVVATMEPAAAAPVKVLLLKDGIPVIGGAAEIAPAPAATVLPFPISVIIKNACGGTASLSLKLEGSDAKVVNVTTVVERL